MNHYLARISVCMGALAFIGCANDSFLTLPVYESPNAVIRLMAIPDVEAEKNFSHPAFPTVKQMSKILKGLSVNKGSSVFSFMSRKDSDRIRQPAFSDEEVTFLAPLLVKGLTRATPDEIVSFYGTADISTTFRQVTSGGVFVQGESLFIVISNFRSKVPIWQDADEYQAPYRLQPLESIISPSGRLFFTPDTLTVNSNSAVLPPLLHKQPLTIGVRYQDL